MKTLVKTGLLLFAVLVYTGCRKADMDPVSGSVNIASAQTGRSYHDGNDDNTGFTADRDKCKKCHTGKSMGIDWTAPYMHDGRYLTITELINDFDFINDRHGLGSTTNTTISESQRQDLLNYLSEQAEAGSLIH